MKKSKHSTFNIEHSTLNEPDASDYVLREGGNGQRIYDLEERLLVFACAIIQLSEKLPDSRAGNHIAGQILRSGTAPYPNHGEAEAAESRDDFIHKLKICHKETRETRRWARLVYRMGWAKSDPKLTFVLGESDELIRIFFSSIQTAKRNMLREKRKSSTSTHYASGEAADD
jgi:four helix bundle protein